MSTQQLEASLRMESGMAIIDLHGEIDAKAEEILNGAYAEAESRSPTAILLNFKDVGYINSTGIAYIVGLLARARKTQRKLKAASLSDHYVEIFQITRIADFMKIFPDEASAIAEG
jgi:anti-anti-sigma factor